MLYSIRKVEKQLARNSALRGEVERLTRELTKR
jgi:hypothetical protein